MKNKTSADTLHEQLHSLYEIDRQLITKKPQIHSNLTIIPVKILSKIQPWPFQKPSRIRTRSVKRPYKYISAREGR